MVLAEAVRSNLGLVVEVHHGAGKLKAQMKKADGSGAQLALILGEDEINQREITVKALRGDGGQVRIPEGEALAYLQSQFA